MEEVVLFCLTFLFVLLIYLIFIVRKAKKKNAKKKPIEIKYLESRYHLDVKGIHYKHLLYVISIVSSFDIALLVSIVMLVSNYLLQLLLALILAIPIILLSYHFVGSYYVKKGMIKND